MANNAEYVELLNTSIIERVVEDHNQAMREDMASEMVGGTRSRSITNVITVKAIIKLAQQEANRQKLELLDRIEHKTKTLPTWETTSMVEGFDVISAIQSERKLIKGEE